MTRTPTRPKHRPTKADRRRFERAVELYLLDCYRGRTVARVSELADFLRRNRPTLSRTMAAIFGKPLGKVLRERQLAYAAKLLKTSPLTVDEIAAAAGFGHRSSFYRQFRRRFGRSPAQYRRAT